MNKPVSFELAKLLKEKGCDIPCRTTVSLQEEGKVYNDHANEVIDWNNFIPTTNPALEKCFISAPTIADVVMWLYEKHGIWIELTMGKDHTGVWFDWDIFSTITPRKDDLLGEEDVEYKDNPNEKWLNYDTTYSSMIDERFTTMDKESCSSPTKAYEAAIEYTLKNLI